MADLELPVEVADNIASWARIISAAHIEFLPSILGNAARDLYRTRKRLKITSPDTDGIVNLEIGDTLATWAQSAGMDDDDAQEIFAQAALDAELEPAPINGKGNGPDHSRIATIVSKAEFIRGFMAPDYLIDGILQRRYIYALTGQTGHAKTAVALLIAQLVGQTDTAYLVNHRVERGRVIYFVGENPDDVRMRVIGSDSLRNGGQPELDNISFIPGVFNIEDMIDTITVELQANGEASLIIVDTSAAYFLGNDELSNTEMGSYARKLRQLTKLPGGPCVLVLCHPIKHVIDWTQLLPRGGGAYLAEMDGNLTLWRKGDDVVELNYTKIRGPGFQPITFKLETIRDVERLVDSKGRKLPTVRAVAITSQEAEARENEATSDEDRVLAAMLNRPAAIGGSFSVWATLLGWMQGGEPYKKRVERVIDSLDKQKPKLVKKERKSWVLTEEGKNVASKTVIKDEEAIDDQDRMF